MEQIGKHAEADVEIIELGGKEYFLRVLEDREGESHLIGDEQLNDLIVENPSDRHLRRIDEEIIFFVGRGELLSLSDRQLAAHIYENCDVLEEFDFAIN